MPKQPRKPKASTVVLGRCTQPRSIIETGNKGARLKSRN